jgi:hypothetical protein
MYEHNHEVRWVIALMRYVLSEVVHLTPPPPLVLILVFETLAEKHPTPKNAAKTI